MKALVVYDSIYGNTEEIARAIGSAITGDVRVIKANEVSPSDLESIDLLIVGSPTYGGRPTPEMLAFLNKVPDTALKNVYIGAFDTRVPANWVKIFGFAAGKIAKRLKSRGGTSLLSPEGFFVKGTKGPLIEGEKERAAGWVSEAIEQIT